MRGKWLIVVVSLVGSAGLACAAEVKGTLVKVEPDAKRPSIVVKGVFADGKTTLVHIWPVADTAFFDADGKPLQDGLKSAVFQTGARVAVSFESLRSKYNVAREIRFIQP